MSNLRKLTFPILILVLFSGCTQIVTAPISLVGSVVGVGIDATSAAVNAVTSDDEN